MLWGVEVHHGEWSQGLRGCGEWEVEGGKSEEHEIHGEWAIAPTVEPMIWEAGKRHAMLMLMMVQDGFMIHSGQPAKDFIDSATRHVLLRQGVLGIKVKIMRGSDPEGKSGPQKSLPDSVTIIEPKEEQTVVQPMSQDYGAKAVAAQQAAEQARMAEQQQEGGEEYPQE